MLGSYRLLLLLLTSFGLLFTACSKKEDPAAPTPAPGTISGQVTPATSVVTVTATGPGGSTATATPDAAGTFQLAGLVAGSYVLRFAPAATYLAPAPVTAVVTAGATTQVPAVAVQQASGSLSGTIAPVGAVTLVTAVNAVSQANTTAVPNSAGSFTFPNLAPGRYYVGFNATYLNGLNTFAFLAYYPPNTLANVVVVTGQTTVLPVVTAAPTRPNLLSTPNWRITRYSYSVAGAPLGAVDLYAQMPACERDNFFRFNIPNQFVKDEGPTKCSVADPQTVTGTWAFDANQANIAVTTPGNPPTSYELYLLNPTTLEVREQGTTTGGAAYSSFITYTAF